MAARPKQPTTIATVPGEPGRLPLLLSQDADGFLSWVLPDNHDDLSWPKPRPVSAEANGDQARPMRSSPSP